MAKQKDFTSKSGNKYIFQKVSPAAWLDILDDTEENGLPKRKKLYPAILENIVVQPKMNIHEFEEFEELEEVVTAAIRFQQNKQ